MDTTKGGVIDYNKPSRKYYYNSQNMLERIEHYIVSEGSPYEGQNTSSTYFIYDELGRLIRIKDISHTSGRIHEYIITYDEFGRLAELHSSNSKNYIEYFYD